MARFSVSKKYNTERLFNIDTTDFEYRSLEELYKEALKTGDEEMTFVVRGVYINTKSLYEPAPVVAIDDCYVNLPSHLLDTCREMIQDKLAVNAINNGEVGFSIYKYTQKRFNKDCYSIRWEDVEPNGETL